MLETAAFIPWFQSPVREEERPKLLQKFAAQIEEERIKKEKIKQEKEAKKK